MSWGYDRTGTREALLADIDAAFPKMAALYAGKPEADDITECATRAKALVAACDLSKDSYVDWNAVTVKASGSHSAGPGGVFNASFTLSVVRTSLAL